MRRLLSFVLAAALVTVCGVRVVAQGGAHLNAVVEKLSRGERVYGVSTYDLSLENARSLARADIDYVYVDMEHGPMDFTALQNFLLGMTDKGAIAESGSLASKVTPLARIAPYSINLVRNAVRSPIHQANSSHFDVLPRDASSISLHQPQSSSGGVSTI